MVERDTSNILIQVQDLNKKSDFTFPLSDYILLKTIKLFLQPFPLLDFILLKTNNKIIFRTYKSL
jgi:hypothetical protein